MTTETVAETVSRERLPDAERRRVPRVRRPLIAVLALLFFFGPAFAFLLGVRPQQIENRKLTAFPSISDGWKFFPDFTAWATDHLPLRAQAVHANTAVSEKVFKEPPSYGSDNGGSVGVAGIGSSPSAGNSDKNVVYPRVIQGSQGWLYYGLDVSNLCQPTETVAATLDRLNRLGKAVEASGRRFVLVVAPDKSDASPQNLPSSYAGKDCSTRRRDAFWKAMQTTPPVGYLDVRSAVLAEQRRLGHSVYRETDTHWGPGGAVAYAQALTGRLDPALAQGTKVIDTGTIDAPGDLGPMIGQPHVDKVEGVQIQRDGVTPVGRPSLDLPEMPYSPETFRDASTAAPLFQPATLILGDSFTSASRGQLDGYFADLTLLHNQVPGPYPQAVADQMVKADVVVYEIVERDIASGRGPLTGDASLADITKTLAANPK